MTATNTCSNFGGFGCSPPLRLSHLLGSDQKFPQSGECRSPEYYLQLEQCGFTASCASPFESPFSSCDMAL